MAAPIVRVDTLSFASNVTFVVDQATRVPDAPQWIRDTRSLPIAYRRPDIGKSVTVSATFSCTDPSITEARIRARRVIDLPQSLGDSTCAVVRFQEGRSGSVAFDVPLINPPAIDFDSVTWQWEFNTAGTWLKSDFSTHEVAITLAQPVDPWSETDPRFALPWWEVLRAACFICRGAA